MTCDERGLLVLSDLPLRTVVSVPPGAAPAAGWPLLLFLHGNGEHAGRYPSDDDACRGLGAHGPLWEGAAPAARTRFLVAAPHLPPPGGDVWRGRAAQIAQIVGELAGRYTLDPARRYLTGFSYGGNGVLDVGPMQADFWAALWPVDPTRAPAAFARPARVWVWYGTNTPEPNRVAEHTLGLAGVSPETAVLAGDRYITDTHVGHVPTAQAAYGSDAPYRWLVQ